MPGCRLELKKAGAMRRLFYYPHPSQLGFAYRKRLAVTPSPSDGFAMRGKGAVSNCRSPREMRGSSFSKGLETGKSVLPGNSCLTVNAISVK